MIEKINSPLKKHLIEIFRCYTSEKVDKPNLLVLNYLCDFRVLVQMKVQRENLENIRKGKKMIKNNILKLYLCDLLDNNFNIIQYTF